MATNKSESANGATGNGKCATRHGRYRAGVSKLTVTVDNADKVRVRRAAEAQGVDDSTFLRVAIRGAVAGVELTEADYAEVEAMTARQRG